MSNKTPAERFRERYEELLKKHTARKAFEVTTEEFAKKYDYELYSSYNSFKAAISRYRSENRLTMLTT
jgi:hypothetical protein